MRKEGKGVFYLGPEGANGHGKAQQKTLALNFSAKNFPRASRAES